MKNIAWAREVSARSSGIIDGGVNPVGGLAEDQQDHKLVEDRWDHQD